MCLLKIRENLKKVVKMVERGVYNTSEVKEMITT